MLVGPIMEEQYRLDDSIKKALYIYIYTGLSTQLELNADTNLKQFNNDKLRVSQRTFRRENISTCYIDIVQNKKSI